MLQPLIKRPWWKYQEYDYIKELIPQFSRYVEPFFGWWGIFFRLNPSKALINDICDDLIYLYKFVKEGNIDFKNELLEYVKNWEKIDKYIHIFLDDYIDRYGQYKADQLSDIEFEKKIKDIMHKNIDHFNGLFKEKFSIDNDNLLTKITKNIIDKLKRTKKLEKEKWDLPYWDLEKNIETWFRSGFYMHFRDIMNYAKKYNISIEKQVANYYFIREFCYASMFRYNKDWHFNIPYWWIAYNNKDFRKKVEYLLFDEVSKGFENTEICNVDFEKLLNNKVINKDDFVFLDPPYDTEFDDYHWDKFTKEDQKRLANCLYDLKWKFLLVIKNTNFIMSLYKDKPGIKIESFEKKYAVSIKWRNDQNVEHLIIYNY